LSGQGARRAARSDADAKEQEKQARLRERENRKAAQRLDQRRKRRIAVLEEEISGLEQSLEEVEREMENPGLARDHLALQQLHERATEIRQGLDQRYEEWEDLQEEAG
jgi:hypothetical protein